jgi:hypothetical protein
MLFAFKARDECALERDRKLVRAVLKGRSCAVDETIRDLRSAVGEAVERLRARRVGATSPQLVAAGVEDTTV